MTLLVADYLQSSAFLGHQRETLVQLMSAFLAEILLGENGVSVTQNADTGTFTFQTAAGSTFYQPLDATLTALAAQNWAANSVPVGTGADTVTQLALAANRFAARSSAGNVEAKTITDDAFALLADADVPRLGTANTWTDTALFQKDSNANYVLDVKNVTDGTSSNAGVRTTSDVATMAMLSHATSRTTTRYGQTLGGWSEFLSLTGAGIIFGTQAATSPLIFGTNNIERWRISDTENVHNEPGENVDFRAEGDTNTHLLFLDASTDRVGINTSTPSAKLHVKSTGTIALLETTTARGSGGAEIDFYDPTGAKGWVGYSVPGADTFAINNELAADIILQTSSVTRLTLTNAGNFGFWGTSFGSGTKVLFIGNATTNPTTNPTAGGVMYATGGAGTWRGSGGTVTTFGPA